MRRVTAGWREELEKLRPKVPGEGKPLFLMLLDTGMRVGEALGLT